MAFGPEDTKRAEKSFSMEDKKNHELQSAYNEKGEAISPILPNNVKNFNHGIQKQLSI